MTVEAGQLANDLGVPSKSASLGTIGASDVDLTATFAPFARRIYCGVGGTIYLKMGENAAFVPYIVQPGQYLTGIFTAVGGTVTGTTATTGVVVER